MKESRSFLDLGLHAFEEAKGGKALSLFLLVIPLQQFGHDVQSSGECLTRTIGVQKGQTKATSEDVDGSERKLAFHGVDDFSLNVRVTMSEALSKSLLCQFCDHEGADSIGV